jgi:integrase
MAGLTQKEIQLMLGHKQMSTTERYLHGAGNDAEIAEKMSAVILGSWHKAPEGVTIQ